MAALRKEAGKAPTLSGADAVKHVAAGDFVEEGGYVDGNDPLGLKQGQDVVVYPVDTGRGHPDRGRLMKLDKTEVVISLQTKIGEKDVRLHAPRHGFRIIAFSEGSAKL
jgi:hypothetical protein